MAWIITSGSLLELHAINPDASRTADLVVLMFANLLATALRFVLLRVWVFRTHRTPAQTGNGVHDEALFAAQKAVQS
jgi:hypothetical protein